MRRILSPSSVDGCHNEPRLRHGYGVKPKYLMLDEGRTEAQQDVAWAETPARMHRYMAVEGLARQHPVVQFTGLAVVFRGSETACREAAA